MKTIDLISVSLTKKRCRFSRLNQEAYNQQPYEWCINLRWSNKDYKKHMSSEFLVGIIHLVEFSHTKDRR